MPARLQSSDYMWTMLIKVVCLLGVQASDLVEICRVTDLLRRQKLRTPGNILFFSFGSTCLYVGTYRNYIRTNVCLFHSRKTVGQTPPTKQKVKGHVSLLASLMVFSVCTIGQLVCTLWSWLCGTSEVFLSIVLLQSAAEGLRQVRVQMYVLVCLVELANYFVTVDCCGLNFCLQRYVCEFFLLCTCGTLL